MSAPTITRRRVGRIKCPRCDRPDFAVDDLGGTVVGYCHRASCGYAGRREGDDWHSRAEHRAHSTDANSWQRDALATLAGSSDRNAAAALRYAIDLARLAAVYGIEIIEPSQLTSRERTGATSHRTVTRGRDHLVALGLVEIVTPVNGRSRLRLTTPEALRHSGRGTNTYGVTTENSSCTYHGRSVAKVLTAPMVRRDSLGGTALLGLALVLAYGSGTGSHLARLAGCTVRTAQRRVAAATDAGLLSTATAGTAVVHALADDLVERLVAETESVALSVDRNAADCAARRDRYEARRSAWRVRRWIAGGASPSAGVVADAADRLRSVDRDALSVLAAGLPDGHVIRWHLPALPWNAAALARAELFDVTTGREMYRPRCHGHLVALVTEADAADLVKRPPKSATAVERRSSIRLHREHPLVALLRARAGLVFRPGPMVTTTVWSDDRRTA